MKKNLFCFFVLLSVSVLFAACTKPDNAENVDDLEIAPEDLAEYLGTLKDNDADHPYTIKIASGTVINNGDDPQNVWKGINAAVESAKKFVVLDLSVCTAVNNTIFGSSSIPCTGNQMNIVTTHTKGIILPESLVKIGDYAFYSRSSLLFVRVPLSVKTVGEGAFSQCRGLKELPISEEVTTISEYAYAGCDALLDITIPEGITELPNRAFGGAAAPSLKLPSSLVNIGEAAFYSNNKLTALTIPASVTTIGADAFINSDNLVSVTFEKSGITFDPNTGTTMNSMGHSDLITRYKAGGAGTYKRTSGAGDRNSRAVWEKETASK